MVSRTVHSVFLVVAMNVEESMLLLHDIFTILISLPFSCQYLFRPSWPWAFFWSDDLDEYPIFAI